MTVVEYSKRAADSSEHTARLLADNSTLLARQQRIAAKLIGQPERSSCLICEEALADAIGFSHRDVPYVACRRCGHIQCRVIPPTGYPGKQQDFSDIYRPLNAAAYAHRTDVIYGPKLAWALRASMECGVGNLLLRSWIEIGSGAGNFVDALRQAGAERMLGLDSERLLADQACDALGAPLVLQFQGSLAEAVRRHPADVYVVWFVLEHCFELRDFLAALNDRPSGTVLLFAVPTFGLSTLLEGAFRSHYARQLDSVLHLQLFTDASIRYAMDLAGYDLKAEWLFGQDGDDLYRAIMTGLRGHYTSGLLDEVSESLTAAIPGIQTAIDRARLSDARHVMAVRR